MGRWGPIFLSLLTIALDVQSWGVAVRDLYVPSQAVLAFVSASVCFWNVTLHSNQKSQRGSAGREAN